MMVILAIEAETDESEPEVARTLRSTFLAHPPSRLWLTFDHLSDADATKAWASIDARRPGIGIPDFRSSYDDENKNN